MRIELDAIENHRRFRQKNVAGVQVAVAFHPKALFESAAEANGMGVQKSGYCCAPVNASKT